MACSAISTLVDRMTCVLVHESANIMERCATVVSTVGGVYGTSAPADAVWFSRRLAFAVGVAIFPPWFTKLACTWSGAVGVCACATGLQYTSFDDDGMYSWLALLGTRCDGVRQCELASVCGTCIIMTTACDE